MGVDTSSGWFGSAKNKIVEAYASANGSTGYVALAVIFLGVVWWKRDTLFGRLPSSCFGKKRKTTNTGGGGNPHSDRKKKRDHKKKLKPYPERKKITSWDTKQTLKCYMRVARPIESWKASNEKYDVHYAPKKALQFKLGGSKTSPRFNIDKIVFLKQKRKKDIEVFLVCGRTQTYKALKHRILVLRDQEFTNTEYSGRMKTNWDFLKILLSKKNISVEICEVLKETTRFWDNH